MIRRVIALVMIISFFLPSLASAISGIPSNYDPQINSQKVLNDFNIQRAQEQMRRDIFEQPQRNFGGNGGYNGNSATSAPTGPATNADELIAQMNQELKLAQSNADGIDSDLLKINNRNSFEKFQISIFGESPEFRRSLRHNIDEADHHFLNIYRLGVECNCIDRSRPIQNEVESLKSNVNSKYSQAESAARNQGIIDKINKVISNSQK